VFSVPVAITDTSVTAEIGRIGRRTGFDTSSRAGLRALERSGHIITNRHDQDICDRRRGKEAGDELKRVLDKECAPIVID